MPGKRKVSGQKLAELRIARKYDQTELAARLRNRGLGATQATISRWENGQQPHSHALPALAAEFGVAIEELFGDDEDEEAASMPTHGEMLEALRPFAPVARMFLDALEEKA